MHTGMLIDIETDQQFLALMYRLQENQSYAVINSKYIADKLLRYRTVYKYHDEKKNIDIYSLNSIKNLPKEHKPRNKGGRPKVLTEQDIEKINLWSQEGTSNREMARKLEVSEGTIRNYFKSL